MIGDMRLYVVAFFLNGVGSFPHELYGFVVTVDAMQICGVCELKKPKNQSIGFKYIHDGFTALPLNYSFEPSLLLICLMLNSNQPRSLLLRQRESSVSKAFSFACSAG